MSDISLNDQVAKIRQSRKLTQVEFADKLWTSPEYIQAIESGERKPPGSFLLLLKIVFSLPDDFFQFCDISVGAKMKKIRNDYNMTQLEFADKLYTTQEYIDQIEKSEIKPPESFLVLVRMVFKLPDDYFQFE